MLQGLVVARLAILMALASALFAPSVQAAAGRTPGNAAVSDTGQATYSIALFTPPGTNGMTPSLSLNYSSAGGNGTFGNGWSLSGLSGISRCGSTWVQDGVAREPRNDLSDQFCLDGQKLRLESGTYGVAGSTYRTEIESFARITANGVAGNGPASFTVETKDGLVYTYGGTTDSRIESLGQTTVRFWAVSRVRDRSSVTDGNAIKFAYTEDTTYGGFRILSISYAENLAQGAVAPYTIAFSYDPIPSGEIDSVYAEGAQIRRVVRASQISVTHSSGTLIRRYILNYEPTLSSTSKSRLASIQECAGTGPDCFSPTTFTYQNATNAVGSEVLTSASMNSAWISSFTMDVNGDGRDDLVYPSSATAGSGTWMVLLANSSGGFNSPINTGVSNVNYQGATTIDYDADGRRDLLVPYSGGTWWVMLGGSGGLSAPTNTGAPTTASGTGINAQGMDVDGDGREDLVWADIYGYGGGDVIRYRSRLAAGGFSSSATNLSVPMPANIKIDGGMFLSARTKLHRSPDFNGDGRADLSYRTTFREWGDMSWVYYYSLQVICPGGTNFGFGVTTYASLPDYIDLNGDGRTDVLYRGGTTQFRFRFSTGTSFTSEYFGPTITNFITNPATIFDWDGDGNEDVLLRSTTTNTLHVLRSTGVGLANPVDTGVPASATSECARAMDINGDGLTDFGCLNGSTFSFRLHSGVYPDLMLSATDGFGVVDTFTYASLPNYANYTKGVGTGFPIQDITPVMNVVTSLTTSDGTAPSSTYSLNTQTYEGARLDLQGRGFLGFSYRSWRDSRDGTAQRRNYRQDYPYIGALVNARRTREPSGVAITETEIVYNAHPYSSGFSARFFPYALTVTDYKREVGGTLIGSLFEMVNVSNGVDSATGSLYSRQTDVTEPAGGGGLNATKVWTARTLFTLQTDTSGSNWCVGRPSQVVQKNSHQVFGGGEIVRTTTKTWDTTYCRETQSVAEPGNTALQVTTDLLYDGFGNQTSATVTGYGMTPRATTTSYANASGPGQFPTSITNAASETTNISWNYALALPAEVKDPNTVATSWQYDAFGRRIQENHADTTYTTWNWLTCSGCDVRVKMYVDEKQQASDATTIAQQLIYLDQFDRSIYEYGLRADGYYNVTARSFDSTGRVTQEYFPYSNAGAAVGMATMTYDLLDRVTSVTRPDSDDGAAPTHTTNIDYTGLSTVVHDAYNRLTFKTYLPTGLLFRSTDANYYCQEFDYDAFGNSIRVTDNYTTLQSSTYNIRGMLTSRTDMDRGAWSFTPNALGELVSQQDAENHLTGFEYDGIGRMKKRNEGEAPNILSYTFNFGTTSDTGNIGRLLSMYGPDGYHENYSYDGTGRPSQTTVYADSAYLIDYGYNARGQLESVTYPSSPLPGRLKVRYEYSNDYLVRLSDFNNSSTVYWTGNSFNARDQVTSETLGYGAHPVQTIRDVDSVTGLVQSIQSDVSGGAGIQNLEYVWDLMGNLTSRKDKNQSPNVTETLYYDNLYRLDYSQLNGVQNLDMSYDAMGNISSKSDVGTYTYSPTKKHQVTSTSNGWTFNYSNNGNMLNGRGATIDWYDYGYPKKVSNAGLTTEFNYTPDRRYWRQIATLSGGATETTIYVGGLLEKVTSGGVDYYRHMIRAGGSTIIVSRTVTGETTSYISSDNLGSNSAVTTAGGSPYVTMNYSAFGARRGTNWQGIPSTGDASSIANVTRRGFTGHTMLDNVQLIQMNGRVYDPWLGRFMSADPYIPDPSNTQSFNRYSYVQNNPLTFTDPTGFTDEGPGWHFYWPSWTTPWMWPMFPTYRPPVVVSPCGSNNCVNSKPLKPIAPLHATPCDQMPCASSPATPSTTGPSSPVVKGSSGSWSGDPIRIPHCDMSGCPESRREGNVICWGTFCEAGGGTDDGWLDPFFDIGKFYAAKGGCTGDCQEAIGLFVAVVSRSPRAARGARPPNRSPVGAGRQGAFNEAKRASGVPTSQQPSRTLPNTDARGNAQPGRIYEYEVPAPGGGTRTIRIRDDAAGHAYPDNPTQNRGPHFNDDAGQHYDYPP